MALCVKLAPQAECHERIDRMLLLYCTCVVSCLLERISMSKRELQGQLFHRQLRLLSICLLGTILASFLLIFHLNSSTVYAATLANDPLVTVIVDNTRDSSCIETFKANIGTQRASTTQVACPTGTILATAAILRSQATTQHEAFVLLSLQQTAPIQYSAQLRDLRTAKQAELRSQTSAFVHPNTGCGGTGSASLQWNLEGAILNANISFYKSIDCSSAYFEDSQINTGSQCPISDDLEWFHDDYAGHEYAVNSAPYLCPAGHYFHLVSQSAPTGYYYENDVIDGQSSWHWDNIGPIN